MTHPVDPEVERAHSDVLNLFRESAVVDPAELATVCRAARDRFAALPALDPEDPSTWTSYELITADSQMLLGCLRETDVPSSEPERFRSLLIRVLRYLYTADREKVGVLLAEIVHKEWATRIGKSHAATIDAAERLAACLHRSGDVERARPVFERVLELRSRTFGDNHPRTLLAACNMGACLIGLQDFAAAFRLTADTVRRCERRLGKDDGTTILATQNLAFSLSGLGDPKRALTLHRDVHQRCRRVSGENSLAALRAEANIATTLHKIGEYEAARALNADLLPRYERAAGKDYSGTKHTRSRLEMNLRALGRDDEADEVHGGIPKFAGPP